MAVFLRVSLFLTCSLLVISSASAQVTRADYERATGLSDKYEYLTVNVPDPATWVADTGRFYYRKSVKGGHEFVLMEAETRQRSPAFDHQRLADALAKETGEKYTAIRLPFSEFTFADGQKKIEFSAERVRWQCDLSNYSCKQVGPPAGFAGRRGLGGPVRDSEAAVNDDPKRSPDGKWEALVKNFNLAVRSVGAKQVTLLSSDGSEGNYYDLASVVWSPDSSRIAAYRVKPGYRRLVHYVESSPEDQLQPKHATFLYTKPGDVLDHERPTLFHVSSKTQVVVSDELFPNPFDLSALVWRKDSRGVTFEYNQRGHAVYRVIEVDASTGNARAVICGGAEDLFLLQPSEPHAERG